MIATARIAAAAAVAAVALALAIAGQAAASAAEQPVGALLSLDGVTYSDHPDGSIFPGGVVLIPGSTATAKLWVRNASGLPADLRIAVAGASASTAVFVQSLTLQAATPGTPGHPVPLTADGACTPLLTGEVLEPGGTTEVQIVLALSTATGNEGQGSTAGAQLAVSLADASAGVSLPPNCDATTGVPILGGSNSNSGTGTSSTVAEATAASPAPTGPAPAQTAPVFGLPTLPFHDQPALLPGIIGGAVLLCAGLIVLLIRKRRES